MAVVSPAKAVGAVGLVLGAWLVAGAIAEIAERTRVGRVAPAESWRRLVRLPRGAWGMTLAHLGLGVFVLGAVFETAWKVEAAEAVTVGRGLDVGAYHVTLNAVRPVEGPNYDADEASLTVTKGGRLICRSNPERRTYSPGGQTTSEVGLCYQGPSHIYLVLGERRDGPAGQAWLVRAYWNPWATLIFLGPVIMGLGGLVSLSDRRLRLGVGRRREETPA
jgi:cytochrome c-type biogenesis protein CcmF